MIATNILLPEELHGKIKDHAKQQNISQAEVIRKAANLYFTNLENNATVKKTGVLRFLKNLLPNQ